MLKEAQWSCEVGGKPDGGSGVREDSISGGRSTELCQVCRWLSVQQVYTFLSGEQSPGSREVGGSAHQHSRPGSRRAGGVWTQRLRVGGVVVGPW